jgi:hypothetical protein
MDIAAQCESLAQRVRQARVSANLTQSEMSARAAMSLPAYKRFETTGKTSLTSFVKILFVLHRQNDLRALLAPVPSVSSLDEFESRHQPRRQRVRKRKTRA